MSGSSDVIARQITNAGDLQVVVRSMKALAAGSIVRCERAVVALQDYERTIELGLGVCLRQLQSAPAVASRSAAPRSTGVVLFGSDQGLVGRFNELLLEFSEKTCAATHGPIRMVWAIGERMQSAVQESGRPTTGFPMPSAIPGVAALVATLLVALESAQSQGIVAEVIIVHHRPGGGSGYQPCVQRLLPLDETWRRSAASQPWPTRAHPDLIAGPLPTLRSLLSDYLFVRLYRACAESMASENASRLAAMQRAERNIDGILDTLRRSFHRLRQESIDEELFDVISGYEAQQASLPGDASV
jgi:F-type H+-transporting ATPase subunit gamma